jgi:hypothetical protein
MMYKTLVRTAILLGTICATLLCTGYSLRTICPYPRNYVQRLTWLEGWYAPGYNLENCSGFLANAHGEKYLNPDDFFSGVNGKMAIIAEFADRSQIKEDSLEPGDVAAWGGHVAAFLKPGMWIDADMRRGSIARFRLQDKPLDDPWFQGKVRIVRWKHASKGTFSSAANGLGRYAEKGLFPLRRMAWAGTPALRNPHRWGR